ncbi:hypothetical protein [Synechococcus sp. M16CYN]|uniref:hypothetical protein n=1 Tax=Synechococcus sp. M16CYN TaxID=3103139 RepID=UPI0033420585
MIKCPGGRLKQQLCRYPSIFWLMLKIRIAMLTIRHDHCFGHIGGSLETCAQGKSIAIPVRLT